jgi:hypothetical protein
LLEIADVASKPRPRLPELRATWITEANACQGRVIVEYLIQTRMRHWRTGRVIELGSWPASNVPPPAIATTDSTEISRQPIERNDLSRPSRSALSIERRETPSRSAASFGRTVKRPLSSSIFDNVCLSFGLV